jgi:hypothetical protein
MSSLNNSDLLCSISSNGDTVALCTPDGVIKFYDALTSQLKLEYSSSSHLQSTCTCLSWPKFKKQENGNTNTQNSKQNSNKKSKPLNSNHTNHKNESTNDSNSIENELNDLNLISIGTSDGAILLYSLTKADLHSQLVNKI